MKTIKIISENVKDLIERIDGDSNTLPQDPISLNKFHYSKEIEDDTYYILAASPDDMNPLNYNGVQIALKLYFRHLQENKLKFFILFLGYETKQNFFFDCDYSLVLKCPNVSYKQIILDFQIDIPENIPAIDSKSAIISLKKIGIKPPASYKSHHSISNEWAISRWSQYLGFKTELDKETETSLYFEYLKTINKITKVETNKNYLVSEGKILLIDDEEGKGWSKFFGNFKLPNSKLKIESIGRNFKKASSQDFIIAECENKIIAFEPETVILDLRLHDSDFDIDNPLELTGFKILEKIKKEINPGIQVILFTASNKIWNYQALSTIGFDGWITKESPELSSDSQFTQKAIKELKDQIDRCQKRAKFLMTLSNSLVYIKSKIKENKLFDSGEDELRNKINANLDVTFDLLNKATSSKDYIKYFNYAYLQLFLCVEEFLNIKAVFNYGYNNCYVNQNIKVAERKEEKKWQSIICYKDDNPSYWSYQENSDVSIIGADFKMSACLIFIFDKDDSRVLNWPNIRSIRNSKAAHPQKGKIEKSDIEQLLDFILFVFDQKKIVLSDKVGLLES